MDCFTIFIYRDNFPTSNLSVFIILKTVLHETKFSGFM